jgi:hypothetical protein
VQNNLAWSASNTSTSSKRRRRQTTISGLYTVGQARIFYSTSCTRKADVRKYASSTDLSYCVFQRLAACNALFNNSATTFTPWTLRSTSTTFSVVDTTFAGYITLSVLNVFGIPSNITLTLANSFGLSSYTQGLIGK